MADFAAIARKFALPMRCKGPINTAKENARKMASMPNVDLVFKNSPQTYEKLMEFLKEDFTCLEGSVPSAMHGKRRENYLGLLGFSANATTNAPVETRKVIDSWRQLRFS